MPFPVPVFHVDAPHRKDLENIVNAPDLLKRIGIVDRQCVHPYPRHALPLAPAEDHDGVRPQGLKNIVGLLVGAVDGGHDDADGKDAEGNTRERKDHPAPVVVKDLDRLFQELSKL